MSCITTLTALPRVTGRDASLLITSASLARLISQFVAQQTTVVAVNASTSITDYRQHELTTFHQPVSYY